MKSFKQYIKEDASDKEIAKIIKEVTDKIKKDAGKYQGKKTSVKDLKKLFAKYKLSDDDANQVINGVTGNLAYVKISEAKKEKLFIKIVDYKDSNRANDILRRGKIKFKDESQDYFVFANENQWEKAMEILDLANIDFDI